MSDGTMLFLIGLFALPLFIGAWRTWAAPLSRRIAASTANRTALDIAMFGIVLVFLPAFVGLASGAILLPGARIGDPIWFRLVALGHGGSAISGAVAGYLLLTAMDSLKRWPMGGTATELSLRALAPALVIFLLYSIGVPGAWNGLPLSGIKAGTAGVEITLASPPPPHPNTPGQAVYAPGASGGDHSGYSVYYNNIRGMTAVEKIVTDWIAPIPFSNRHYFHREAVYIGLTDPGKKMTPARAEGDPNYDASPIGAAMAAQRRFLIGLGPLVACIGVFHEIVPDVLTLRQYVSPALEHLVQVEWEARAISLAEAGLRPKAPPGSAIVAEEYDDLARRLDELAKEGGRLIVNLRKNIPMAARNGGLPEELIQDMKRCDDPNALDTNGALTLLPLLPPEGVRKPFVLPPYLAMFLANAYAALQSKDRGIELLHGWIAYAGALRDAGPGRSSVAMPDWLYHRAVMDYGYVQEGNEAFPSTVAERHYLAHTLTFLAAGAWDIDLEAAGGDCGKPENRETAIADAKAGRNRLTHLAANIVQRYLHASVETRSLLDGESLGPEHAQWARRLIVNAERCLPGEDERQRQFRRIQNLAEAGLALSRWSVDGARAGWLRPTEAAETRKEALKAMLAAMPSLRRNSPIEKGSASPVRATSSLDDVYRRLLEREILALTAADP